MIMSYTKFQEHETLFNFNKKSEQFHKKSQNDNLEPGLLLHIISQV